MFHAHGLTFSARIVNAWNFLPDIDFSSLSRFKRSVHKVDFSRFLQCFKELLSYYFIFCTLVYFVYLCFFLKGHHKSLS